MAPAATAAHTHSGRKKKKEEEKSMPPPPLPVAPSADRRVMMKEDVTANRANPNVPNSRCWPHLGEYVKGIFKNVNI